MKKKPFGVVIVVLVMLVLMTGYALWETFFQADRGSGAPQIKEEGESSADLVDVELPDGLSWQAPGIEVGILHYTVTRTNVLHNVGNAGLGSFREGAIMNIYDSAGQATMYRYPDCINDTGSLVEGGNLVILDVTVTSQDAVNFITDPETGVQSRRYADNPFLFRADEIGYLVDITEQAEDGYTYYDAVFFSEMGRFTEHPMAYEVLPGESISFRIGYLVGNRRDGSEMEFSDVVLTTNWGEAEKEYYDIHLPG